MGFKSKKQNILRRIDVSVIGMAIEQDQIMNTNDKPTSAQDTLIDRLRRELIRYSPMADGRYLIHLPMIHPSGDGVRLILSKGPSSDPISWTVSDDGSARDDLDDSGCDIDAIHRVLETVAATYGLTVSDRHALVLADIADHDLAAAIIIMGSAVLQAVFAGRNK